MSLRNWLSPKPPAPAPSEPVAPPRPAIQPVDQSRAERAALRELLYPIVRESIVRSGILSSHYKFKVLSTDSEGRRFLVMVDLAPDIVEDPSQLARAEALMAQQAMARHELEVSGAYWRFNAELQPARSDQGPPRNPSLGETQPGELR